MASCRIQESKKKARRSINCTFLGGMMIRGRDDDLPMLAKEKAEQINHFKQ